MLRNHCAGIKVELVGQACVLLDLKTSARGGYAPRQVAILRLLLNLQGAE